MIPRLVRNVSLSASVVYELTIIHHVYGALAFSTPWRHHAAFLGLGGIAATLLFMWAATRSRTPLVRQVSTVLLLSVTLVLAVALIGLFEGGYNHVLKLVLFFGGATPDTMTRLFPPPTYEMPSDVFFEVTGVLQFRRARGGPCQSGTVARRRPIDASPTETPGADVARWRSPRPS